MERVKVQTAVTPNTILFAKDPKVAVSVVLGNAGLVADADGKKILKAGTPVYGDLTTRTTPFVLATTTAATAGTLVVPSGGGTVVLPTAASSNAVGIVQHDVDVTDGNNNGSIIIAGVIDLNKLTAATVALLTATVKTALKHIIFAK